MADPNAVCVMKDEFLNKLERSLDHLPGMTVSSKKRFVKKLKLRCFSALNHEDSARPLASQSVEMVELNRDIPNGVLEIACTNHLFGDKGRRL